jgi:hypothetical protein
MGDILVAALIALIIGLALTKIIKDGKNGSICSSCPQGKASSSCHNIQTKK